MRSLILLVVAAVATAMVGCGGDETKRDGRIDVVVSIEPQRAILEAVGGDRVAVTTLLSNGSDPETFDPTMASMMRVERARAWMMVGHMAFEEELVHRLEEGSRHPLMVDTSEGVKLITGSHGDGCGHGHDDDHDDDDDHGHHHDEDPHTWGSVANLKIMGHNMLLALNALSPGDSAYFNARYQRLAQTLDSIDADYAERLTPVEGRAFMVWHPSLSYFARDYGLTQLSVTADHREVSLLELQEVIDHAVKHGADLFVGQSSYDPSVTATISRHIGAGTVMYDPLAYDWRSQLDTLVARLETSATKKAGHRGRPIEGGGE
ncbi:MAG: zinc ABC transporter substrate-binding protein [Pseudoflavonifractor sp.]|nr:zinc ABC transporter substrate-binding protein [Alloprevotella sp.]MCM1116527.1 zinc ABC transporter substrate-binding protein [Pseudoflavonifractor sp.]